MFITHFQARDVVWGIYRTYDCHDSVEIENPERPRIFFRWNKTASTGCQYTNESRVSYDHDRFAFWRIELCPFSRGIRSRSDYSVGQVIITLTATFDCNDYKLMHFTGSQRQALIRPCASITKILQLCTGSAVITVSSVWKRSVAIERCCDFSSKTTTSTVGRFSLLIQTSTAKYHTEIMSATWNVHVALHSS